jgi:hypothetical protein
VRGRKAATAWEAVVSGAAAVLEIWRLNVMVRGTSTNTDGCAVAHALPRPSLKTPTTPHLL